MKKHYIKPAIQVFTLAHNKSLLYVVSDYENGGTRNVGDTEEE
jgi:hypothetical protein